jgi:DNA repair protein RadA/Sms
LYLLAETALPHILAAIDQLQPDVVVIDSIQSVYDPDLDSGPGSVTQVRECAAQLVRMAKGRIHAEGVDHVEDQVETGRSPGLAILLVGHVTKEGSLAGPRVLEHVVDTVLAFEGDRHHALRLLRAVKHRFGSTTELGVFEMAGSGLREVADPSALFLGDRRAGVAGSAVVSTIDGHRPLLVEIQALVAPPTAAVPRRGIQGLDPNRLPLLLAVLERRCHLRLTGADIYVSAVGGVRLTEPGVDLALGLALASSHSGVALPHSLVACGEVGLGGELRQVPHTNRRLAEAARLGFRHALVPASAPDPPPGLALTRVVTLAEALEALGLAPSSSIYGLVSGRSHLDSGRAHSPKRGDDRCVGSGGPGSHAAGGT